MDQDIDKLISQFNHRGPVAASAAAEEMRRLADRARTPGLGEETALSARSVELARLIDHTALKPETSVDDVVVLCREALEYGFASVCINPCYVPLAAALLEGSPVATCTVVGFPLGASSAAAKAREAETAVEEGAAEVDMVMNVGMLKSGARDYVEADIRTVVDAVGEEVITKVILETALLTEEEKVIACLLARSAGADFVKTSTGFSTAGATPEDVALMRHVVGEGMKVKASGGIRTATGAREMIAAGASRIGASSSVAIVRGDVAGSSNY